MNCVKNLEIELLYCEESPYHHVQFIPNITQNNLFHTSNKTTWLRSNGYEERYCNHFKIAENKFRIQHKSIAGKSWKRRSLTRLRTTAGQHLVVSEAPSAQTSTGTQTQTQAEAERMTMTIDLDEGDSTPPSSSRPHSYYPKLFLS